MRTPGEVPYPGALGLQPVGLKAEKPADLS